MQVSSRRTRLDLMTLARYHCSGNQNTDLGGCIDQSSDHAYLLRAGASPKLTSNDLQKAQGAGVRVPRKLIKVWAEHPSRNLVADPPIYA
jgi:hypothetical protein